ncbi:hybrid sensor histidine kinase/response regulator transcription factor [Labilibacter marinus]|uniref:hybrid sensor histidine kinase/response regulator transcription factor n=1 Tax=Labilibacter marinus TaxID=1477105 RepID=UPI00094FA16A|nr:hybrid sensor histidine kinase/response regulator transcription factor [Labilibacter marinus]
MIHRFLVFGFLLFLFPFANAQYYSVNTINTKNGLSQNDVTCILQDSFGFMWFGTHDGLNRFDGKTFKKYHKGKNGLSSGIVQKIVEDKNHNLWIGTTDGGICRLNLKTGKIEECFSKDSETNALIDHVINDIVCDDEGTIWYVTNNGVGSIRLIGDKYIVGELSNPSKIKYPSAKFVKDERGQIWVFAISIGGRIENNQFIKEFGYKGVSYREFLEYSGQYIFATSGTLWFGKNFKRYNQGKIIGTFSGEQTREIELDYDGNLWVGTRKGLYKYKYDNADKTFVLDQKFEKEKVTFGLYDKDVRSIYVDRTGIIYIGTYGHGVKKLNPKGKKFRHYLSDPQRKVAKIRSVYQDSKNDIYIGSHEGQMFVINEDALNKDKIAFKDSFNIDVGAICIGEIKSENNKQSVIVGGEYYNALTIVGGDQIELPNIGNNVFTIYQGKNGLVWIGTYGAGLYRFDPSGKLPLKNFTPTESENSISSNIIRTACEDVEGRIWIGTDNGVNILEEDEQYKENPSFINIKHNPEDPKSISHDYIISIIQTKNNDIWLGTMGEGLNKLTKYSREGKAEFESYKVEQGLINNVIRAIVEDDAGNLWISSNRGISKLNPSTNDVTNFDVENGLQDYEFSDLAGCKLNSGMLLFGGVNGVNAFYPMEIKTDWSDALPVFTSFSILNNQINVGDTLDNRVVLSQDINLTDEVNIDYQNNSFSIQFASLHYAQANKNKCKYILEGFDMNWTEELSGGQAKYTNLRPGKYQFKLMAANGDGVWNEEVKSLTIVINPPLLLTNWMFGVYAVIIVLLLLFFRKFSIIGIKRKHELTITELEKEKEHELNQMKIQFFMNISHEFKTPLTLIVNPLEQLLGKGVSYSQDKLKNYHEVMYRNAKMLMRLINQLMEFRKIELGMIKLNLREVDIKEFLSKLHESFSTMASQKDIKFNLVYHGMIEKLWVDPDKLEKVLNNVLSNAFKYTPEEGEISLELIDDTSDFVTVIISDNGEGIPADAQADIFDRYYRVSPEKSTVGTGIGLSYTKSLIELMQGEIKFKSKMNEGTVFFIKLPKDKSKFKESSLMSKDLITDDFSVKNVDLSLLQNNTFTDEDKMHNNQLPTILIVEDNKDLCIILSDALVDNFNVQIANDGKEGIEKSLELVPDLIITDVSMPIMDGIEMTSKLKKTVETSHIPIVMLTAHASESDQMKGLKTGADIYISKPFNINVLTVQMVSLLKNRQALRSKFQNVIDLQPSDVSPTNKDEEFLQQVMSIVEENISNADFTVQELAKKCGFSQVTLNSKLDALTGKKAKRFIRSIRVKRACQLLLQGDLSVSEVTYDVGFNDLRYFRECFTSETGYLPSEYKSKQEESE